MRKFWSHLAVQLGKRAGLVSIIGLAITLLLGLGIPKLEFATGQDSYLNEDDQVAIDNVTYQELFGGQIMLVLFTVDEGQSVADLASPENAEARSRRPRPRSGTRPRSEAVITRPRPAAGADPDSSCSATDGNPVTERGRGHGFGRRHPTNDAMASRSAAPERRMLVRPTSPRPSNDSNAPDPPPEQRNLSNRAWVDFLLHDNEGGIRKALLSCSPTSATPRSSSASRATPPSRSRARAPWPGRRGLGRAIDLGTPTCWSPAPPCCSSRSTTTSAAACSPSVASPS